LVDELSEAGYQAARTESEYKSEAAKCQLSIRATAVTKMTVDEVAAEVQIACEQQHLAYLIAANNHVSVREACRACTTRVDALRSLAASFRSASG
jgi:hypothetical protein